MSIYEDKYDLFEEEQIAFRDKYPNLHFREADNVLFLEGKLEFNLTNKKNGKPICDSYLIQIILSQNYPEYPPKVKEIGGKIDREFHVNPDGTLCLDVPSIVYLKFKENPTILHFIRSLLEPFLYSYSYKVKYKDTPFGEYSHGGAGIIQYYSYYFKIKDHTAIVNLLKVAVIKKYKQSMICPCGSKKKIKKCHKDMILILQNDVPQPILIEEIKQICLYLPLSI